MKTKGSKTGKLVRVLGFVIIILLGLSVDSFAAEKMWKALEPVVEPDGSVKFVDRLVPESDVPVGVPPNAVGVFGWKDEKFNFERVPPLDTSKWTGTDYYKYYESCMGLEIKPARDYAGKIGTDLEDKRGRKRIQRYDQFMQMLYEGGIRYKKQIYFTFPPEVKGMSYLIYKYSDPKKADDMMTYGYISRRFVRYGV